jgi:hypothetical protein
MISIENFTSATFEKKCDVVTGYSNYITMRKAGECKIYLYHTGIFFIEVYYSPVYQKVLMIHPFNDSASLEPYAEIVSLADLSL